MADWKTILWDKEERISDEELLKYLDENTSAEEKDMLVNKIENSPFEEDALQGLQQLKKPAEVKKYVEQINRKLRKQLHTRNSEPRNYKLLGTRWVLLTLLLLLFICVVGYLLVLLIGGKL